MSAVAERVGSRQPVPVARVRRADPAPGRAAVPARQIPLVSFATGQGVNVRRHLEALRDFRRTEFGTSPARPSEAHIQAVNDLLARLRHHGAEVRRLPGPVVVARTRGRGGATSVVYGHLDVKPPGPGWTTPPFRPVRLGHRLQARGASDDKGQVMPHLVALAAWAEAGGPPGDVVTIIDGAEEVGSPGLSRALAGLGNRSRAWSSSTPGPPAAAVPP